MHIKGCGKLSDNLTFYQLRGGPKSDGQGKATRLACGHRAETLSVRGILLCAECASKYRFKPFDNSPLYLEA
jgi:hypothetical protein